MGRFNRSECFIDEFATAAGIKTGSFLSIDSIGEETFKIEYREI